MHCHRHLPALIKNRNKDEYSQNNLERVSLLKTTKTIKISTKKKNYLFNRNWSLFPNQSNNVFPKYGTYSTMPQINNAN
jgi:hypothetical protein